MTEKLAPILTLIDQGLILYRRHFISFLMITASWFVPVAIATSLIVVASSWLDAFWPILLSSVSVLVGFPLLMYLIGGLSRAAMAAADGQPVHFRTAMAIPPRRALGMGCFTLAYAIVVQIVSGFFSIFCVCPIYIFGVLAVSLVIESVNTTDTYLFVLIIAALSVLSIYLSMIVIGAFGNGLFYALQPWVQEARPFGVSLQRSVDLLSFRFVQNLLLWCIAALLTAAAGLAVMATIGVLLPLPLLYILSEGSPITRAVSLGAWLLGFMVVLPPLPIWMVLLYRRQVAMREGSDLVAKVATWLPASLDPGTNNAQTAQDEASIINQ